MLRRALVLLCALAVPAAGRADVSDTAVKAAFIPKFARYVTWPASAPAHNGAQIVICIIGDGGLHFTMPELASAADAGTPVIVLLWNDRRYGEIEDYMVRYQIAPLGVRLHATDFAAMARAFGAEHVMARSLGEVRAALAAAATRTATTIVEMDASDYA